MPDSQHPPASLTRQAWPHYTPALRRTTGTTPETQLRKTEAEVQQMIQDRLKKVEEIKQAVELSKSCAQREMEDSVQVFTALRNSIERSQAELIELIEEKQRAAERRAEGIIKELEQEITELKRRNTELEQLSQTEEPILFLQSFPSLCSPPHPKDWSDITVHPDLCLGALSKAVCQLEDKLREEVEKVPGVTDVTLDPNTADPRLILSEDGKQVRLGDTPQDLPDNPERFDRCVSVLGKDGITSGRHYWEVEVGEKTNWTLGVARESINRKGVITLRPQYGYWAVWLRNGNEYWARAEPPVLLPLSQKPQKVGVYVDYEGGQVSFYNVDNRSHIYTFTASFTEKLFPYFSPGLHQGGTNSAPLIICPVSHTD
ncbi:A33 protein, partial [Atractosteus spatula]|nr:A33 protein [Atractosteus spatula]